MITFPDDVLASYDRSKNYIRKTPLDHSPSLSELINGEVYLKLENVQKTGSFKFRGAISKITSLSSDQRNKGVVTASTGNHGAAVSLAMKILDVNGKIVVPKNIARNKLENIKKLGGIVEFYGKDCIESEFRAQEISKESGSAYISPYNDPDIVTGQGTIAVELDNQLNNIDEVIVSVGGGGLISGIGGYLNQVQPKAQMVACSPKNSCVMYESLNAGRILDLPSKQTLSDGTAGGVEEGSITFDICKEIIDDFVLVTEREIASGIRTAINDDHQLIEGSAGAAIAALFKRKKTLIGKRVIIIICGGNINSNTLHKVLS
ncbi:MAG: threonine/serine dehydratase [Candidatus Neomarinimicrobiota bacterium]|nr:threonine/serine dehydratase [Candidatus Neomarinimicrobiota bacterium]MEC9273818.1 threonine/serine dehydratase [Candidatus Neomarinimicrobiota bacterium]|tara:strand:- start:412 stop:1368 length:957 start_codon:yes stop_codon:yes gene_type:complete